MVLRARPICIANRPRSERWRRRSARTTSPTNRRATYFVPAMVSPFGTTVFASRPFRQSRESGRSSGGTPQFVFSADVLARHGDRVHLDQPPQQGDREVRLDEPRPADDAGGVDPASVASVMVPQVHAQPRRPGLDLDHLADGLPKASFLSGLLELLDPRPALGRRPAQHDLEEVEPLLERERLEGVDAAAVEQAARNVQVLLVGLGIAAQRDAACAGLDGVHPFVGRGDSGADDDVLRAGLVLLGLVRLYDTVAGSRIVPRPPVDAGEGERAVADRDHRVLAAPEQDRILVVKGEMRRWPRFAYDPAHLAPADQPALVPEGGRDDFRLGEDLGDAGIELAKGGAEERPRIEPRVRIHLRERRPVCRHEMRLGLGAQNRLPEVPGVLLVRVDGVRLRPEDADLLRPEAEVDRGRIDVEGAEAVPHYPNDDVLRRGGIPDQGAKP